MNARAPHFTTGHQLRVARTAARLTQPQLAEAADVHLNTVNRYEATPHLKDTAEIRRLTDLLMERSCKTVSIELDELGILTVTL